VPKAESSQKLSQTMEAPDGWQQPYAVMKYHESTNMCSTMKSLFMLPSLCSLKLQPQTAALNSEESVQAGFLHDVCSSAVIEESRRTEWLLGS
jgi:hypothetical protein